MSLTTNGVWAANVWAPTVWGECVWYEPSCPVAEEAPTGGWYEKERRETEEEKRLERIRLGIIEPEKKKKKPRKVEYVGEIDRIEQITDSKEIDKEVKRLIIKMEEAEARKANIDTLLRIHLSLAAAEQRARQIEEEDIVFVMTMLMV